MSVPRNPPAWRRALLLASAAAALAIGLGSPAAGDYTRSCNAELVFAPRGAAAPLSYDFSVARSVDLYAQVNRARREARQQIIDCVRDHWAERAGDSKPRTCRDGFRMDFRNYPFNALESELHAALCTGARAGRQLRVDVDLYIRGQRGCVESEANMDPHDHFAIARDYRVQCLAVIVPGLLDLDLTPGDEGSGIGDGGADERGGDEPSAPDPATASFAVLPNVRLPGNDITRITLPGPGWQQCRDLCRSAEYADRCEAFTYRAPTATTGPVCLLKRMPSVPIPDGCCVSGIKQ